MPPALFHSSTASLAPLSSQAPSELSWPLCASTRAILIGPVSFLSPEPLLEPGVEQPTSARTAATPTIASRDRTDGDMTLHLNLGGGALTRRRRGRCP